MRRDNAEVIALYHKYLEEEEAKDPGPEGGHSRRLGERIPKMRAAERVKDELGYQSVESVRLVILKWERKSLADITTYGMELDRKFSEAVRLIQDSVGAMISACDDLAESSQTLGADDVRQDVLEIATELREKLDGELPAALCPYCKAVYDGCKECDGDGWFCEELEDISPWLVDDEEVHIQHPETGKVVLLSDWQS